MFEPEPEEFIRATGVVESERYCTHCKNTYRVASHATEVKCPRCGSSETEKVTEAN